MAKLPQVQGEAWPCRRLTPARVTWRLASSARGRQQEVALDAAPGHRLHRVHAQSCPTLCVPTDGSPPGSSVHGILQARILVWVAFLFSRGSF